MLKKTVLATCCSLLLLLLSPALFAQEEKPDTVRVGIYVTSIHNIDFKEKEFTVTFWLWLKYKNREFDFQQNIEIPQAKTFEKSYSTIDTSDDKVYLLMKMQCVMKDSWRIENFPFDKQTLRLSIENSQFDSRSLVFVPDTLGKNYDPRFTLRGWNIDSFTVSVNTKAYETAFGDESMARPHTEYSAYRAKISISRDAGGLFWKMFLGMYIAFLIAYVCFYIHADGIDSRFGLSVGSLFAVIGNKYIVDSSLPESLSFTLVDALHGITLFAILTVIGFTAYSLKLVKQNKTEKAARFDFIAAQVILVIYLAANAWLIFQATSGNNN
ncbi:MAG: hypothetical protein QM791_04560 [Ferruginibacter sp.]